MRIVYSIAVYAAIIFVGWHYSYENESELVRIKAEANKKAPCEGNLHMEPGTSSGRIT
jgi:hypothetical protein